MGDNSYKLMIAGGGTGGHILAGVAVAEEWIRRTGASKEQILFVGASGGLEEKLVPQHGFPLRLIRVGTLNRVSIGRRLKTILQLPVALFEAIRILFRERPACLLGVGGYASGPVLAAAWLICPFLRTKIFVLEQNAVPGMTNRLLGRISDRVFAAQPGLESYFGSKVHLTGNPTRSSMKPFPPASRSPTLILAFGGSQGAIGMNTLIIEALPHLEDLKRQLKWIHQTGKKDLQRVSSAYRELGWNAEVLAFIEDMPSAYAAASLVICRAGASTLSELAAVGRAAVFVPLPTASDDHQMKNARIYEAAGAAIVVDQLKCDGAQFARRVRELLTHPERFNDMENAVRAFHRPDAAKVIVDILLSC